MRRSCSTLLSLALLAAPLGAALAAGPARPAPKAADKKAAEAAAAVDPAQELLAALRSGSGDAVEAAEKLCALPPQRSTEHILNELAIGVSPKVANVFLDALAARKDPQSIEVLAVYANHRSPELRKKALTALGTIPGPQVVPVLIAALSDSTTDVRATAAEALGRRRERTAEGPLLKLLSRGDSAAAPALGAIGGPDTARGLGELVGTLPDRLLIATLGELLKRGDFGPDPLRLEVVQTLGKLAGTETVDALSDFIKGTDKEKEKYKTARAEALKIIELRTAK